MSAAEWKKRCEAEWGLQGAPMPDHLDWKSVCDAKPFGRNLLRNPSPHGTTTQTHTCSPVLSPEITVLSQRRDQSCHTHVTSVAGPPARKSSPMIPLASQQVLWFSMEQVVDLKAEGLWEELLDDFQPQIAIEDWYEESQLHDSIYQLTVKLLGADKSTVLSEHAVNPTEDRSAYSHTWKEVSYVFSGYGPGVRYVHFLHRLKNSFLNEFFPTLFTGSSVVVRPIKSSS
ncbi:hypothetical protein FQN60_000195 [Etheostoma spectabile]|uniref:FBA domain-containing protein n=1 Tax=Etheostoma spectabile TaxID=54343 RepID=A0A5J5CYW5_9PERO|nr:hypothetical protein FQN60_000195 [Etheostoma spectabile]